MVQADQLHLGNSSSVGLIGPNGAGKTSLLLAVAGLLRSRTNARIHDTPSVAFLGQAPEVPEWLGVAELLQLYGSSEYASGRATVLKQFGTRRLRELSTGQRQLAALVATLELERSLTLLDEPFATLDLLNRRAALEMLREFVASPSGARVLIVSSQAPADLHELCDHFIVLRKGSLSFQGSFEALTGSDRASVSLQQFENCILQFFR